MKPSIQQVFSFSKLFTQKIQKQIKKDHLIDQLSNGTSDLECETVNLLTYHEGHDLFIYRIRSWGDIKQKVKLAEKCSTLECIDLSYQTK